MARRRSAAESRALKKLQDLLDQYQSNEISREAFNQQLAAIEAGSRPSQRQRIESRQKQYSEGEKDLYTSYKNPFHWVLTERGYSGRSLAAHLCKPTFAKRHEPVVRAGRDGPP